VTFEDRHDPAPAKKSTIAATRDRKAAVAKALVSVAITIEARIALGTRIGFSIVPHDFGIGAHAGDISAVALQPWANRQAIGMKDHSRIALSL
jgi:hypothetical protein